VTGFKVNTPPVIHQTLDGEVIAVNLDSGTYYSIAGTGATVWGALETGATVEGAVDELLLRYEGERGSIEASVRTFVDELVAEELVSPAENGAAPRPAATAAGGEARQPFAEPRLERYTDMQELLMLDPIHEVDEQGWPSSLDPDPGRSEAGAD
jgi:hypothetical protein